MRFLLWLIVILNLSMLPTFLAASTLVPISTASSHDTGDDDDDDDEMTEEELRDFIRQMLLGGDFRITIGEDIELTSRTELRPLSINRENFTLTSTLVSPIDYGDIVDDIIDDDGGIKPPEFDDQCYLELLFEVPALQSDRFRLGAGLTIPTNLDLLDEARVFTEAAITGGSEGFRWECGVRFSTELFDFDVFNAEPEYFFGFGYTAFKAPDIDCPPNVQYCVTSVSVETTTQLISPIPTPGSLPLLLTGLCAAAVYRRRRRAPQ